MYLATTWTDLTCITLYATFFSTTYITWCMYNLKNQQDSSNLWPGYKNWCWLLIFSGVVKCNVPLNEFLVNLIVDSGGGSEDTLYCATGLQIMIAVNYKYSISSMCITYVSVIIQLTGVLISPYPDQEGNKVGSMSGIHAISTTSRRELSSSFFFFPLQGKAPKEILTILTETLACFLPGRAKDLSPPLYF